LLEELLFQNELINSSLKWSAENVDRVLGEIEVLEESNKYFETSNFEKEMERLLKELNLYLAKSEGAISEADNFEEKLGKLK
jgi:hypothetical protein